MGAKHQRLHSAHSTYAILEVLAGGGFRPPPAVNGWPTTAGSGTTGVAAATVEDDPELREGEDDTRPDELLALSSEDSGREVRGGVTARTGDAAGARPPASMQLAHRWKDVSQQKRGR